MTRLVELKRCLALTLKGRSPVSKPTSAVLLPTLIASYEDFSGARTAASARFGFPWGVSRTRRSALPWLRLCRALALRRCASPGFLFVVNSVCLSSLRRVGLVLGSLALALPLSAANTTNPQEVPRLTEWFPSGTAVLTNLDMVLIRTAAGSNVLRLLPGSLGEHVASNLLVRLQGRSPALAMDMFKSSRTEARNIVRNPDFWLHDLPETTAYSAIRVYGLPAGKLPYGVNATLVTRRHFLQCKHNQVPLGSPLVYVTKDNVRVVRFTIDWYPIGTCDTNAYHGTNDGLILQQLNEAVPDEIIPLKLLPDDANRYFGEMPPFVSGRQSKRFGVIEAGSAPFVSQGFFGIFRPLGGPLTAWSVPMVGGDSGSTSEYVINGHLVLVMPLSSPILAAAQVLNSRHGTTELPRTIDLSAFPRVR